MPRNPQSPIVRDISSRHAASPCGGLMFANPSSRSRIRVDRLARVIVGRPLIEADVREAVHDDREVDAPFVHQLDDIVDLELAIAFLERPFVNVHVVIDDHRISPAGAALQRRCRRSAPAMLCHEGERVRHPRALGFAAGVARGEMRALSELAAPRSSAPTCAERRSRTLPACVIRCGKSRVPYAMRNGGNAACSCKSGLARASLCGIRCREIAAACSSPEPAPNSNTRGERQATANDVVRGAPMSVQPRIVDRQQRGVVTTGGMTADEECCGSPPCVRDVAQAPTRPLRTQSSTRGGKHVLWREPVAGRHERDAGVGERRRHERHPFLVARRPPAAMPEQQHASIGARRRERPAAR